MIKWMHDKMGEIQFIPILPKWNVRQRILDIGPDSIIMHVVHLPQKEMAILTKKW